MCRHSTTKKSKGKIKFSIGKRYILIVYTISEIYNSFLPKAILGQKFPHSSPGWLPMPITKQASPTSCNYKANWRQINKKAKRTERTKVTIVKIWVPTFVQ